MVSVRREVCPRATWDTAHCAWVMSDADAAAFLRAAQARMFFRKCSCTLAIDGAVWVVGFKPNTPYRLQV